MLTFLSDPSPIINCACQSLTDRLTPVWVAMAGNVVGLAVDVKDFKRYRADRSRGS